MKRIHLIENDDIRRCLSNENSIADITHSPTYHNVYRSRSSLHVWLFSAEYK